MHARRGLIFVLLLIGCSRLGGEAPLEVVGIVAKPPRHYVPLEPAILHRIGGASSRRDPGAVVVVRGVGPTAKSMGLVLLSVRHSEAYSKQMPAVATSVRELEAEMRSEARERQWPIEFSSSCGPRSCDSRVVMVPVGQSLRLVARTRAWKTPQHFSSVTCQCVEDPEGSCSIPCDLPQPPPDALPVESP